MELRPGSFNVVRRRAVALTAFLAAGLLALPAFHSLAEAEAADPRGPGTLKMAARLRELAEQTKPMDNRFASAERVPVLQAQLQQATDDNERQKLLYLLGSELLNSGRNSEALQRFEELEKRLAVSNPRSLRRNLVNLKVNQALCWLRAGEITNCLADHNPESCLAPIQGSGVHRFQEGSRRAMGLLTNLLQTVPDDLMARWLLNVASMTVGDYPQKMPARWLVPPSAFASEYDIKRFPDVAAKAGLDVMELAGGSVVEDFDRDGDLDIVCSSMGLLDQMRFFLNNGDGSFTERTAQAGLLGEVGGLNLLQTDYNNDGFPDLFVLRGAWMDRAGGHPNSLLRNNGDGTFEDVTEAAGLLSFRPTQTAVWLDYDNDGWLDLFIGNESLPNAPHPCELFHNQRDGTFVECAAAAGVAYTGYVKGVCSADYNQDGRPDLYLSVLGGANLLYRNNGPGSTNAAGRVSWRFTDVARQAGVTLPSSSFGCWFFDYDNDGWEDLFVAGYRITTVGDVCADYLGLPHGGERARLFRNQGNGTFQDVTRAAGLDRLLHAMGCNYGDLDNDGYLDFYLGTGNPDLATIIPNRMFRNDRGQRFQDVTTSGGFGHLQKGHGISFADIDNDGDQDVYEDMGGAVSGDVYHNVLFENPGHGNHWLTLKLEGDQSNRAAVGARIAVTVATREGARVIRKTVRSGGSFGASPLRQEIGLGQAQRILSVDIFWPKTGKTQTLTNLSLDQFYSIREDASQAVLCQLKPFTIGAGASPSGSHQHHHGAKH